MDTNLDRNPDRMPGRNRIADASREPSRASRTSEGPSAEKPLAEKPLADKPLADKPMGLRERKKARQKEQILNAAIDLFREQGYDETRVADIVEACEISQPTFFRYFPSKDAIVEEIASDLMTVLGERDGLAADETVRSALKRRYRTFTSAVIENRELAQATCSGLRIRKSAGGSRTLGTPVLWAMKRGQETGEVSSNLPADVLADLLSGMLGGIILQWAAGGSDVDLQGRVDVGIDLFFRGAHP